MTDPALTDRILRQGKALVRAIEALGTIEPSGPVERAVARVLMTASKQQLRGIVEAAPAWVSKEYQTPASASGPGAWWCR